MRATQQRKRFVSRELVALAANQPQAFADYSEGQYRAQIESIADEVLSSGRHIVMLTGPSAAGKTTSAHKIADAIAARGCRSAVVSLDDFYAGAGRYPKHPDGTDDYESLGSLDLPVLQECLAKLHTEGVCKAPIFDFKIQQPNGTRTIDCRDGVVIIEGLHALNPALTERLPADAALCLYAGLREEYAAPDSTRCLATRDIRLARRLVRDCLFRGHGAAFTLGLWGKVCAGEDQYIKPFKPRAGGVMRLETLIADVTDYVTSKIKENQTVSDDELPQTAKCIAMAALKYGDLSNMPTKDYVFDLDRFSSFEGNTGPYILYTIVRIKSILAKYGKPVSPAQLLSACSAEQKQLMLVLSRMADALWSAYRDSAPNAICAYIYELAGAANKFYHDVKIISEPDAAKQASYIALMELTRGVLEACIDLLGSSAPERM